MIGPRWRRPPPGRAIAAATASAMRTHTHAEHANFTITFVCWGRFTGTDAATDLASVKTAVGGASGAMVSRYTQALNAELAMDEF